MDVLAERLGATLALPNEQARRNEIKRRYNRHARECAEKNGQYLQFGVPFQRVTELERLALDRYQRPFPHCIPDTTDGFKIIRAIAEHLVIQGGDADPRKRVTGWCEARVRWMTNDQAQVLADLALNPEHRSNKGRTPEGELRMPDADVLARDVGLDMATRTRLGIRTIGAIDCPREQRELLRKDKQRDLNTKRRRAEGQIPRDEYLAKTLSRTKPWERDGVSRATWYRRGGRASDLKQSCPVREVA